MNYKNNQEMRRRTSSSSGASQPAAGSLSSQEDEALQYFQLTNSARGTLMLSAPQRTHTSPGGLWGNDTQGPFLMTVTVLAKRTPYIKPGPRAQLGAPSVRMDDLISGAFLSL
ncbi:hypothetical protein GHT09_019576 [Marmota monax]|uniref:Uncharacterized protein n=1 Tax=Marmota monax TaxID=9995 RepID=A0A834UJ20_MARMO|nr:hypothetical protein GHT09_019576 [Marmota monax]